MRHLLSLEPFSAAELEAWLALIARVKKQTLDGKPPTAPKTLVANLFFETSTRTRTSFEFAERRLGLEMTSLAVASSSVTKGESLIDTVNTLMALGAKVMVIRHASSGAAEFVARRTPAQVINAGDGQHQHPTQGLLDLFTLHERWGSFAGKRVAIIGDVRHSRVARSSLQALPKLGAEVTLFGPTTLVPKELAGEGVRVAKTWGELKDSDAVMVLRLQKERMEQGFLPDLRDYVRGYGLTGERLAKWFKPEALVMHPGPMNRGVEVDSDVADSPRSLILKQVENGLYTRMAVFLRILGVQA